jgi:cytochrome c oxidase subunit 2
MFGAVGIMGKQIDGVFLFILVVCVVLLALITASMTYFVIKYRKYPTPAQIEGNRLLETIWTVVPVIVVLTMFYYGSKAYTERGRFPKEAIEVNVTARQWAWSFEYANGLQSDVLNVPVGKPVKLKLTSSDVIHSFYVPAFRVKEDVVPGRQGAIWFAADEEGSYDLFCTEYCGLGHSMMLAKVSVMAQEEFKGWLSAKVEPEALEAAKTGQELIKAKGCTACHTTDGTPLIGPTFKGIFGRKSIVVTGDRQREVIVDERYLRTSMLEPKADVVKGFPPVMPSHKGILTDEEIEAIIEYLKTLK